MVDFAALPPEVNSARIYTGAGAGPLVAAASAWDGLAAELSSAARSYEAVVSELTGEPWLGPSSQVVVAAAPYIGWVTTTAVQAEQTANQARAAAAAYEAAFVATVPPPLIAANRALLAVLVVTNVLGQNSAAIAANEAQYAEYWAQDASALYTYAANAAAATVLTPFAEPQQNTNPGGTAAQGAAVAQATGSATASNAQNIVSQVASAVPNALQSLAQGIDPSSWINSLVTQAENVLSTPFATDLNYFLYNVGSTTSAMSGPWFLACVFPSLLSPLYELAFPASGAAAVSTATPEGLGSTLVDSVGSQAGAVGSAGLAGAEVSAGLGGATTVGGLSVPQTWAAAAPEIRLAAAALPAAGLEALPDVAAAGAGSWFGGVPIMGNMLGASRGGGSGSSGSETTKNQQVAAQLGASQDRPGWWRQPERRSPDVADDALTEREREELAELRKEITELAMERDAAARLIKEVIAK